MIERILYSVVFISISQAIEGKLFDRYAVQNIVKFMRMAIVAAKKSASKVLNEC